MAKLSTEERIRRIELAPAEIQVKVAKAFLRDDIDDEDVQYLFNTDGLDILCEDCVVENINAELPEGIGATGFIMRTTKPKNNKNYITTGSGGWNTCIKGYPMETEANALANCVGGSSGRFNEVINLARDTEGCTYKTLNSNAENFIERAKKAGLKVGMTPKRGAIMCWQKGATLSGNDGAGHVANVERVDSDEQVYTWESNYGGKASCNVLRSNKNGRWGIGSGYTFRGFIYLPDDVQKIIDEEDKPEPPTPTPVEEWPKTHTVVRGDTLSGIAKKYYGNGDAKHYNFIAQANGIKNPNIIRDGAVLTIPEYKEIVPEPERLKVGDTIKIIGTGNGSSNGTGNTAYGIGWTRTVLRIWDGRAYPYQIGNNTGTTGFYKAEALQKK